MSYCAITTDKNKKLQDFATTQFLKVKRDVAGDAPSSQKEKNFPIDNNHALDFRFLSYQEERIDMLKTNKNMCGLLCAGSDCLREAQILHLLTIVEKAKGETIIRGYYGTSLSSKVEVEFSIDFLLDIVATAAPI